MSQKKWKFNVIDVIVVVLILAVAALLVMKFAGGETYQAQYGTIQYTAVVEDQPVEVYEGVQEHVPAALMASGARYDDQRIGSVSARSVLVRDNGEWVEDPHHVDIIFTVEGTVEITPVMTTTVATQEIRVGREIILKTEYLEFDPAIVTAVEITPLSGELGA